MRGKALTAPSSSQDAGTEAAPADESQAGGSSDQPASGASGSKASLRPGRKDHAEYPPGLSFSTVLNGVLLLQNKGQFRLHHIQGTFLPDGATGWAILSKPDGTDVCLMDFKSEKLQSPYFLLDFWRYTDMRTGEELTQGWLDLKETGDYVLDFYLPDEHFFTFPFSVSKAGSDDPFGGGRCLLPRGGLGGLGLSLLPQRRPLAESAMEGVVAAQRRRGEGRQAACGNPPRR